MNNSVLVCNGHFVTTIKKNLSETALSSLKCQDPKFFLGKKRENHRVVPVHKTHPAPQHIFFCLCPRESTVQTHTCVFVAPLLLSSIVRQQAPCVQNHTARVVPLHLLVLQLVVQVVYLLLLLLRVGPVTLNILQVALSRLEPPQRLLQLNLKLVHLRTRTHSSVDTRRRPQVLPCQVPCAGPPSRSLLYPFGLTRADASARHVCEHVQTGRDFHASMDSKETTVCCARSKDTDNHVMDGSSSTKTAPERKHTIPPGK